MKAIIALVAFTFLFYFSFVTPSFADNLLQNSSFEDFSSGIPSLWTKNVSTATLGTSTTSKTGSASASINKNNGTTGSIYAYQDIDVDTSAFYRLSGFAIKNDPKFSWVVLRLSWRDASSEISKTDSPQLISDSSDFQQLQIDSVAPPSQAIKARVELVANIQTGNPVNPALFDDITLSQVEAPIQPTSTPIPVPTSTPTSTPTPTPTQSPTPSPVSSKTPAVTLTPTPLDLLLEEDISDSAVLATEDTQTVKPTSIPVKTLGESKNNSNKLFIVLGAIILGVSGILGFLSIRKNGR